MIRRSLLLILPLAGLALSSAEAAAKTIPMGSVSRAVLRDECLRAGGKPVGIDDENATYGCLARWAAISCTPDADCAAFVRDTIPVVGNSLRAILNLGQAQNSSRIQPLNARVDPAATP